MVESTLKIRQINTERNLIRIRVMKMMVVMMIKNKEMLLEIRNVFAALLCIKIFLEKTLTSEEIETNGGMEGW